MNRKCRQRAPPDEGHESVRKPDAAEDPAGEAALEISAYTHGHNAIVHGRRQGFRASCCRQTSKMHLQFLQWMKARKTAATVAPSETDGACPCLPFHLYHPGCCLGKQWQGIHRQMGQQVMMACDVCDAWHAMPNDCHLTMKLDFWVAN